MGNRIQPNTCTDIISRIQTAVSSGELTEANELILLLEENGKPSLSPREEMKYTMLKGLLFLKTEEFKIAEENLLRSLELAKTFGETRLVYIRYDNLVTLYMSMNQLHQAIVYLRQSMELKESAGDDAAYARSLLQMTMILISIEDYNDGRDALEKADVIISQLGDREIKMHYHFAKALLCVKEKDHIEALFQYDLITYYAQEVNDIFLASRVYFNQGDIMMELKRWDEARQIYEKLHKLTVDNHLLAQELLTCARLAMIALRQNDPKRSRVLYDYITSHTESNDDDTLEEQLAELAAELFEAEGNHHEALKAYRSYMQNHKKHYDNEQSKVILYIKARYENERKEREIQEIKLSRIESEMKTLKAQQTLRDTEKRFKSWIENGTEMILILNKDRVPAYISPYTFKLFGYTKDDIKNQKIRDLIHPEDVKNTIESLCISESSMGMSVNTIFRFLQKNGNYRWVECTMTNLLQDETVKGIVCNLRDITERKQSKEAIQELNRSLEIKIAEQTNELKDAIKDLEAFSYSVSHDLRSPLRIIAGYTKLLVADYGHQLNDEAKEMVDIILDSAKRMSQLIDDLLNLSRMGRQALYKTHVDMNALVSAVLFDLRKENPSTTDNIIVHRLAPAYCDSALIKQVWINLISNAIKYSSKKSAPLIEIGCIAKANETTFYIKDNGAGFDMRFAKNLFTVFKRLHDRSDFEGTGVGLALAHRIIKMHEGRIWAEAEVEKGATFYFTLGT